MIFDRLYNEILNLHYEWQVFMAVYGKNEEQVKMLNSIDSQFFSIVQNHFWDSTFLSISRVTDRERVGTNNRNLTLYALFNDIVDEIDTALKEKLQSDLDQIKLLVQALRKYRSKRIAHHDFNLDTEIDSELLNSITRKRIEETFVHIQIFMNRVEENFKNSMTYYKEININGGTHLIEFLKESVTTLEMEQ